ncbi:GntR family transcriptional regulator, partial [Geobacillus stearothermophilus]
MYAETLKHIHRLVVEDGLVPGDKLPSERELAERLGVGRSS